MPDTSDRRPTCTRLAHTAGARLMHPGTASMRRNVYHRHDLAYLPVQKPGVQPVVQAVQSVGGDRDDCGQFGVGAIVEELIELLAHPGRHGLRAQVIQDQQRRGADLLEPPVERGLAGRAESSSQVIEQIRNHDEERGIAQLCSFGWRWPPPGASCRWRSLR